MEIISLMSTAIYQNTKTQKDAVVLHSPTDLGVFLI